MVGVMTKPEHNAEIAGHRVDPAVPLPRMINGKTIADQDWWNATPESRWGPGAGDLANYDDIWARCWAYIEEKGLEPPAAWIVWDIAYAAIEAMAVVPQSERGRS